MLTWNNEKPFTYSLDRKSKQFYLLPQTPSQKINVQQSTYSLTAIKYVCVYKLSAPTVNNIIVDQHWCIILPNHILQNLLATWLSGKCASNRLTRNAFMQILTVYYCIICYLIFSTKLQCYIVVIIIDL